MANLLQWLEFAAGDVNWSLNICSAELAALCERESLKKRVRAVSKSLYGWTTKENRIKRFFHRNFFGEGLYGLQNALALLWI